MDTGAGGGGGNLKGVVEGWEHRGRERHAACGRVVRGGRHGGDGGVWRVWGKQEQYVRGDRDWQSWKR